MSSGVTPYPTPTPIRSSLLRSPPDAIPPVEELEALQAELKSLKQRTLERAKKAGDDLRTIEESMRRLKEKEKGKGKAIDKVKKERGLTPLPNGDERRLSAQPQPFPKSRPLPIPVTSMNSGVSTPLYDSRRSQSDELKKKKKKRKREDMSDTEPEPQKARKTTPVPQYTHPHPHPPPKASKFPSASTHAHPKPAIGPDFSLPVAVPLLPTRPAKQPPPTPGPSRPTEVTDDFSKAKVPNQVLVTTFYTSIEPWLRPIGEGDVGFLEYTQDEVEPFVMPKLGRPYSEVWEEEDIAQYGGPLPGTAAVRSGAPLPGSASNAPLPKWEPSTLSESDIIAEERGHGPLTERLVSALIPMQNATEWKGVKAAEEAMEGRPGTNGAAAQAARDKLNVADLEERIRNVLRFYGILDEIPDYTEAVDDPIATALRHAQRELRNIVATNKARRARLAAIARDRLAYQEYIDARDALDKNIVALYTKLQKKDGPKANKKKKKPVEQIIGATNGISGSGLPMPSPAALGLVTDDDLHLSIPDQLKQLVETRRKWVDTVGTIFEQKERGSPGRIFGFPKTSIYEGIEDEIRQELERLPAPKRSISSQIPSATSSTLDARTTALPNGAPKGKGKIQQGDIAMELG